MRAGIKMKRSCSRTLLMHLNVVTLPRLKGNLESVFADDEQDAKHLVSDAKGFSNVIILRKVESIDGVFVRLPNGQNIGSLGVMLDYLEKSHVDVGAYSNGRECPFYRFVYTDFYGPKQVRKKIYEVVAPSIASLEPCYSFLKKYFGGKD